jgi:hypothetical protein
LLVLAGCGRLGFEARARDANTSRSDGAPDAFVDLVGCSDGQRDGLEDMLQFPNVAACKATWAAPTSLRAPRTGAACGDDLGVCAVPADACSAGWHVCGDSGDPGELTARLTDTQCQSPAGAYVAALVHCQACDNGCFNGGAECHYAATYDCRTDTSMLCAEAVCCGQACGGTNMCRDGVWAGATHTNTSVCGATDPATQDGVLCCR